MFNAFITGASRGIGKAIKILFEQKGINVFSPGRSEMDLCSNESINNYLKNFNHHIDILINNAGINELASLDEINEELSSNMIQINLNSQLQLIKHFVPNMIKKSYGKIINISSIWCHFSKERRILYSMTKAGVVGLTTSVAVELAKHNILVNAVAPGFVNTELTSKNNTEDQIIALKQSLPIKRLAEPKEIAEVVYFLSSENNSFITGQTIFVDGGFSCV